MNNYYSMFKDLNTREELQRVYDKERNMLDVKEHSSKEEMLPIDRDYLKRYLELYKN